MSDTTASKEYSEAEFEKIINKLNTYRDYKVTLDENGNEKPTNETGVVESNEGSNIEERIAQLYSKTYRECNTAFLGYRTYDDIKELMDDTADELTDNQKINSQFMVKTTKGMTTAFFDTLRFHNRPIYCGVNVLYDPTVSDKFVAIANNPTKEYVDNPWNAEYDNAEYNSKDGSKTCRDLCFNKTFLEDLQAKANDESELVMAFIRKGFEVGIGEVNDNNLTSSNAIVPPMYGRVFENIYNDGRVPYSPVIIQSMVNREIPVVSTDGDIVMQQSVAPNNNVYFTCPSIEKYGKKIAGIVDSASITKPSIIYVGENIDGYSLFSFINVPVCSWEYFKSKSSGFGSGDPSKPTKVVQRLEDTQCCGPFMRIKAKGYYTSETNEVLRSYSTIKFIYDNGIQQYPFDLVTVDGKVVWGPPEGNASHALMQAALSVYNDYIGGEKSSISYLVYANEEEENRDKLYENAYIRGDLANPTLINNLFNEVSLPNRFAFYIYSTDKTICIAQFPSVPLIGAKPLTDDYITQWVPLYKKTETDPSSTEITWYINRFDILVKRGNNDAKFYNINRQETKLNKYPKEGTRNNRSGYIYTCNGIIYSGPVYEPISNERLTDDKTKLKEDTTVPLYIDTDNGYVQITDGGDYSKWENAPRFRKFDYIPDNIQGITLSEPNDNNTYISGPITIAQYNNLAFMENSSTNDQANISRKGYVEFIKNGCVFITKKDISNDPKVYIPDTVDFTFDDDNEPVTIEPKVEAKVVEEKEPESNWWETVKIVLIAVLAVVIIGLIIFIVFKVRESRKENLDNFTCPDWSVKIKEFMDNMKEKKEKKENEKDNERNKKDYIKI